MLIVLHQILYLLKQKYTHISQQNSGFVGVYITERTNNDMVCPFPALPWSGKLPFYVSRSEITMNF